MSGTPASGCPGTPPPPESTDTSLSTSLRVWICHEDRGAVYKHIWGLFLNLWVFSGSDESFEVPVGDVTSYQLHNLKPGTTYDLKVLAQYNTGDSAPLIGEGTTCKLPSQVFVG